MRVFLDTNVIASALGTRGICEDVVRDVFSRHELVISELLLQELARVLLKKFKLPRDIVDSILVVLRMDGSLAEPTPLVDIQLKDRSDIPILSAAVNGGAEVFVTGDKELLRLAKVGSLLVVSPRGFWDRVAKRQ